MHRAARLEDGFYDLVARIARRRGWQPRMLVYTGYGTDGWVRVFGRVLLTPPGTRRRDIEDGRRGWRRFFSAKIAGVPVTIDIAGTRHEVSTGRGGYVDELVPADLAPGWSTAQLRTAGASPADAPVHVLGSQARRGVVSDIDDTVMITALPRPLLAFWNTFVRTEASRRPVPGIAQLYRELAADDPGTFFVYLSTGPWNVAPALDAFLDRHGFPRGPLLLTDWGPTPEGWFRSGREHKRAQLHRLISELPQLHWLLVGDDGQHDPELYAEAAEQAPGRVRAVVIRQLTATEQVLTHGTPEPLSALPWVAKSPTAAVPVVSAPDGFGLLAA
ncbi:MAG: phosphatase domain-containing protein, partial [Mycobacteriales bacterium]